MPLVLTHVRPGTVHWHRSETPSSRTDAVLKSVVNVRQIPGYRFLFTVHPSWRYFRGGPCRSRCWLKVLSGGRHALEERVSGCKVGLRRGKNGSSEARVAFATCCFATGVSPGPSRSPKQGGAAKHSGPRSFELHVFSLDLRDPLVATRHRT